MVKKCFIKSHSKKYSGLSKHFDIVRHFRYARTIIGILGWNGVHRQRKSNRSVLFEWFWLIVRGSNSFLCTSTGTGTNFEYEFISTVSNPTMNFRKFRTRNINTYWNLMSKQFGGFVRIDNWVWNFSIWFGYGICTYAIHMLGVRDLYICYIMLGVRVRDLSICYTYAWGSRFCPMSNFQEIRPALQIRPASAISLCRRRRARSTTASRRIDSNTSSSMMRFTMQSAKSGCKILFECKK